MSTALVLSGGSIKGAFQVGAIKAIIEKGINKMPKSLIASFLALLLLYGCSDKTPCEDIVVQDFPQAVRDCIRPGEIDSLRKGLKQPQDVWKDMKRRCPGVDGIDNGFTVWRIRTYPKCILISSKQELIDSLKKITGRNDCCIKKLIISGHGRQGVISTGDGQQTLFCKHINDDENNMAEWKRVLAPLKDILCKNATIILDGCNVGEGDIGLKKLQEICKEYGVTVIAPTDSIKADKKAEELPDSLRRKVSPTVSKIVAPPTGQYAALSKANAEKIKRAMKPSEYEPFSQQIIALGIYPATYLNIPLGTENIELPITDIEWMRFFVGEIDSSLSFAGPGLAIESDVIIVVRYVDRTYHYGHGVYDNNLFMITADDGNMIVFPVSERGRQLFLEGMKMTMERKK